MTESPIIALTCQRDTFAIGHEDGTIAILRLPVTREIGKRIHSSNGTADASISTVQFSKAGKWLLVAMSPRALLWETGPGSPKNPHTFEHAASTTAALSPDAQWVAFAGAAGTELFEVRTSQKIPLPDPIDKLQNLNEILFSPNSSRVVYLSSREGEKKGEVASWVWNLDYLKVHVEELRTPPTRILAKLSAEVHQAAFDPDGRRLLLGLFGSARPILGHRDGYRAWYGVATPQPGDFRGDQPGWEPGFHRLPRWVGSFLECGRRRRVMGIPTRR